MHVLRCTKFTVIDPEVRELQLAVAASLGEDIVLADERWIYHTSLSIAQRMHAQGARMIRQ